MQIAQPDGSIVETRRAPHMERYTEIRPVIVRDFPDAHSVWLRVGNQSFVLSAGGQDFHDTREQAEWARDMLCIALDGMTREFSETQRG
jgi:hypothetical protein